VSDAALEWKEGLLDLAIRDDDLAADEDLRTAALLSLFTDRRAEIDDELPADDEDRRGWWADQFASIEGDRMGSRLWLLDRPKQREDIAPRAEELIRESLAWMLEDRLTERIDVEVETRQGELLFAITLHRPQGDPVSFRFAHVWEDEADRLKPRQ
jgi:phage gp46-like protein